MLASPVTAGKRSRVAWSLCSAQHQGLDASPLLGTGGLHLPGMCCSDAAALLPTTPAAAPVSLPVTSMGPSSTLSPFRLVSPCGAAGWSGCNLQLQHKRQQWQHKADGIGDAAMREATRLAAECSTARHTAAHSSAAHHGTPQHSTAQHSAVQRITAHHSTAQHSTVPCSAAPPCLNHACLPAHTRPLTSTVKADVRSTSPVTCTARTAGTALGVPYPSKHACLARPGRATNLPTSMHHPWCPTSTATPPLP